MGSLGRRLRRLDRRQRSGLLGAPEIRVVGYGAPGVVKVEFSHGGPSPGVYAAADLGLVIHGSPPFTHLHVLERGAGHG